MDLVVESEEREVNPMDCYQLVLAQAVVASAEVEVVRPTHSHLHRCLVSLVVLRVLALDPMEKQLVVVVVLPQQQLLPLAVVGVLE